MDELLKKLIDYGLTEREATLYLTSLKSGESGMTILAKRAGIKRSTAYLTFESLESRGLMGSLKTRLGLRFIATKPELFFAREERRLKDLSSLLPQFKNLSIEKLYQPKILFYEGREGYRIALEDALKKPNITLRYLGSIEEFYKVVGEDYDRDHIIPRRVKSNIWVRNLTFDDLSEKSKNWINPKVNLKYLREIRLLPKEFDFKSSFIIYGDRVVIFAGNKEKIVVIIESQEIALSEQRKLDLIWSLIGKQKGDGSERT